MRKIITRSIGFLLCVVVAIVPVYASMNHVETIKINNEDIQKIWETGTEIDRANISNSYKAIKGNFNTNSMTLYSGTKVQSLRQSIVDTNYYRCCCNRNRKNAGCLYMGDYDVSGKYKSGFD